MVQRSWNSVADSTQTWTSNGRSKSFKAERRIGLGPVRTAGVVPRGGKAASVDIGDVESPTQQIRRHALVLNIDEQDIIDDNFEAIEQQSRELGDALARVRPGIVYGLLRDNANFLGGAPLFDAGRDNTATDTLSADTVGVAAGKIAKQTAGGVRLGLRADTLVVTPALERAALGVADSFTVANDTRLRVVTAPELGAGWTDPATGTAHAGSDTEWYLVASESKTVEVSYLDGQTFPSLREKLYSGEGRYGISFDGKLDVGAAVLAYQALYRGNT